ncbi:hypothetical protein HDU93_003371, partial [Gonapodya sp. JEL0774]
MAPTHAPVTYPMDSFNALDFTLWLSENAPPLLQNDAPRHPSADPEPSHPSHEPASTTNAPSSYNNTLETIEITGGWHDHDFYPDPPPALPISEPYLDPSEPSLTSPLLPPSNSTPTQIPIDLPELENAFPFVRHPVAPIPRILHAYQPFEPANATNVVPTSDSTTQSSNAGQDNESDVVYAPAVVSTVNRGTAESAPVGEPPFSQTPGDASSSEFESEPLTRRQKRALKGKRKARLPASTRSVTWAPLPQTNRFAALDTETDSSSDESTTQTQTLTPVSTLSSSMLTHEVSSTTDTTHVAPMQSTPTIPVATYTFSATSTDHPVHSQLRIPVNLLNTPGSSNELSTHCRIVACADTGAPTSLLDERWLPRNVEVTPIPPNGPTFEGHGKERLHIHGTATISIEFEADAQKRSFACRAFI